MTFTYPVVAVPIGSSRIVTNLSYSLGAGMVINDWDEGVQRMKEGGQRVLIIQANLGCGARGACGVVPPNATLMFCWVSGIQ